MTAAIRLEGVTFSYPDTSEPVLRDVDLLVEEGTFALVVGHTGAGKSTLLRTMNGLVPHFSGGTFAGAAYVAGRSTVDHPPRRLSDVVAFVPQNPGAAFVVDRVEDELAYGMENLAVPAKDMRRRVEEVLDLLDIARLRERSVRALSGGERQRVAIAAALTAGPRILLLDEPTSQLDPQGAEDVLAALQRLVHDLGMTVIAVEHRLERVAGFADTAIGCLGEGRVVAGDTREVLERADALPPVAELGRLLGLEPLPLTVREARRLAPSSLGPDPVRAGARETRDVLVRSRSLVAGYDRGPVLHGIDLGVEAGELLAVMGRNGSGKTTLLRSLAGLHRPASGDVRTPEGQPRLGGSVALCPQEAESILFRDSVRDEVDTTIRALDREGSAEEVLALLGIDDLADAHPRELSAGQRLLVALAAIVATGAHVLLLDEPTRGLDRSAKALLVRFLRNHAARGGAVVVATHDVELVGEFATRIVLLAQGEIISDGEPRDVIGDSRVFAPQTARVFGPGWLTPASVARSLGERVAP
jgi:energy-coupling factor transport system ATP-binding protein